MSKSDKHKRSHLIDSDHPKQYAMSVSNTMFETLLLQVVFKGRFDFVVSGSVLVYRTVSGTHSHRSFFASGVLSI